MSMKSNKLMMTEMTLSEYIRLNPSSINASLDKLTAVGRHINEIDVNDAFLVTVLDQCRQTNKVSVSRSVIDEMCSILSCKYKAAKPHEASSHVTLSSSSSVSESSAFICSSENNHNSRSWRSRGLNIALAQKLQTVLLSRNKLSSIIGVVQFRHVVRLSLLGNHIRRIDDCEVLSLLPQLQFLSLEYNPVTTLLHYRAHLLRICAWPHNLDIHTCRLRKLDAVCVEAEEIMHAKYCIEREYILLPELMHRHQFLCFLVHLETTLKVHCEMAKRGLLVVNHLEERCVDKLLRRCATAALNQCHTAASMHATRLWVSQQQDVNCNALERHNTEHYDRNENNKTENYSGKLQNTMRTFTTTRRRNAAVKSLSHKSSCIVSKHRSSKQFYEASNSSHSSSESEEAYESARCSDEVEIPHSYFTKECTSSNNHNASSASYNGNIYKELHKECSQSEYIDKKDSDENEQETSRFSSLNVSNITLSSDESSVKSLLNWSRISLHNAHHALDHDLCTEWSNSAFRRALTLLDVSVCNCLLRVARCCHETLSSHDLDRVSLEWLHLSATHSQLRNGNVTCSVDCGKKKESTNMNTSTINNTKSDSITKITELERNRKNNFEVKMEEEEEEQEQELFPNCKRETEKENMPNNDLVSEDDDSKGSENESTSHFSSSTSYEFCSSLEQKKEFMPVLETVTDVKRKTISGEKQEERSEELSALMTSQSDDGSTFTQTKSKHEPEQEEEEEEEEEEEQRATLTKITASTQATTKTKLLRRKLQKNGDESSCQIDAYLMQRFRLEKLRYALRQWRKKLREVYMHKKCIQFAKLQMERRCEVQCSYVHFTLPVYAQLMLLPYTERKRAFFHYWRSRLSEKWLIYRIKLSTVLRKWYQMKCDAQRIKELQLRAHLLMKRSVFDQWYRHACRRRDYAKALFRSTLSESVEKNKHNSPRMFSLSPPPTFPEVQLLTPSSNTDSKSTETMHSNMQPSKYENYNVKVEGNNNGKDNKLNGGYFNRVLHSANSHDNDSSAIRIVWNTKFKENSVPKPTSFQCSEQIEETRSHRSPLYKSPFIFSKRSISRDDMERKECLHQLSQNNSIDRVSNKGDELKHENNMETLEKENEGTAGNNNHHNCGDTINNCACNREKMLEKSLISCHEHEQQNYENLLEEEQEEQLKSKLMEGEQEESPIQIKDAVFPSNREERDKCMLSSLSLSSSKFYNEVEHTFTSNTTIENTHERSSEDVVLKHLQTLSAKHDTLRSRFFDQQIILEEAQLRRKEALNELERLHSLLVERENEAKQIRISDTLHSQKIIYLQESLHALEERHRKMMERICNDDCDELITVHN